MERKESEEAELDQAMWLLGEIVAERITPGLIERARQVFGPWEQRKRTHWLRERQENRAAIVATLQRFRRELFTSGDAACFPDEAYKREVARLLDRSIAEVEAWGGEDRA